MRTCLGCGHENLHSGDFCVTCGEYLRWSPTEPGIVAQGGAVHRRADAAQPYPDPESDDSSALQLEASQHRPNTVELILGTSMTEDSAQQVPVRRKARSSRSVSRILFAGLALTVGAALVGWMVLRNKATVPSVTEADNVLDAQVMLAAADLKLGAVSPIPGAEPGALLRQSPGPGKRVDKGSAVSIEVGVGPEQVDVPQIEGMTVAQADAKLREAGLQLGGANRALRSRGTDVVSGQGPAPGKKAPRGSPVTVLLSESRREPPAPREDDSTVPSPAAPSRIVFDRDGDLFLSEVGGATRVVVESRDVEEEPSWSPNGKLVAYRRGPSESSGGQIWLLNPDNPASNRPFGEQGYNDGRPAFSPDGRGIAFIRESTSGSDSDLCFKNETMRTSSCIVDPQTVLSRPAWSPDGRSVLVVARKVGQGVPELGIYRTQKPSSMASADWSELELLTEGMHGGQGEQVLHAAWSPDGNKVAFTANWGQEFFYLLLSNNEGGRLAEPRAFLRARGCEVAWRPDGLELALTVGEDESCPSRGSRGRGIVRLSATSPAEQTPVSFPAKNPAWAPPALVD